MIIESIPVKKNASSIILKYYGMPTTFLALLKLVILCTKIRAQKFSIPALTISNLTQQSIKVGSDLKSFCNIISLFKKP